MSKRPSANKRATPTGKGETPPILAARKVESKRVEEGGIPGSSSPRKDARSPSREQIAIHAYHRWLSRGKPAGTEREDWIEAERQLAATA